MEDNILIVENAETSTDVINAYNKAVQENKEFYVAISKSGKKFGVKNGAVCQLGEGEEYAVNEKFVAPVETPVEVEVIEEKIERTNEEIEINNRKIAEYEALKATNAELQEEIAKLNAQIDELTIKLATPIMPEVEKYETTLDDVINFMTENGIHTLGI